MKKQVTALFLSLCILLSSTGCVAVPGAAAGVLPSPVQTQPIRIPAPVPTATPAPTPIVATLAVVGDVMTHMPVTNDAWDKAKGEYDYTPIMAAAQPIVERADYAVGNLETTLAGGPTYSGYPAFNAPDALAHNLKDMGFDLMLTANNHSLDKGGKAVSRTLDVLDQVGLKHVGTSRSQAEFDSNVVLADVGGISVAFLGYTYGTNGIPLPKDAPYAVNLFNTDYTTTMSTPNTEKLVADLAKAKQSGADLIAVMIHWGVEYQIKQNQYQDQIADLLFQNGADIILGGHPHVLQPMELRTITAPDGSTRTGFICYSLGNFISSQTKERTDTTAVVTLELTKDQVTGKAAVTGYTYVPMYMLNRGKGADNQLELLDAHAILEGGSLEESLIAKVKQSLETCHAILGPQHDPRA